MSLPLVRLDALGPRGLDVAPGAWADTSAAEGAGGPVAGLSGNIHLERHGPNILAEGDLAGTAAVRCARCLAPLERAVSNHFACLYTPLAAIPERSEEDEGDPALPEALVGRVSEFGEYDGVALDLRDVVREFFALEVPTRLLCADQPGGEDAECLSRWRAHAGNSDADTAIGPFAALASLKIRK